MGLHQRTETSGLVSFIICAMAGAGVMELCVSLLPAAWMISRRQFVIASIVIASCGTISFIFGYARRSSSFNTHNRWIAVLRRMVEILALATVYASTLFLTSFAILSVAGNLMGPMFLEYITPVCAGFSGAAGYITFVQAELMDAKTLAGLLPLFVVAGVSVAGLTTDDPNWYTNNFSQLGDRTTFAAHMFNSTLILAGICIIIVSYFAISELVTSYRQRREWHQEQGPLRSSRIKHYKARLACLSAMLTFSGIAFIGIGTFRYTPHPILHNVFARGIVIVMGLLLLGLPWLAPQLSLAIYTAGYLAIVVCGVVLVQWMMGSNTMTNVEALAGLVFLGWFIMFSRQIAAIEADRIAEQVMHIDQEEAASGLTTANIADTVPSSVDKNHRMHSRIAATQ